MKNFDTRTYNISDFLEWYENGLLELSPEFQRRSVWSEKAKSYLIDTIIRGKPMPKILISQKLQGAKNVRVVVDGQQRLRTIIAYYNGDFKISKVHNKEFAGCSYDLLPSEVQSDFLKYELGVDVLFDMPYEDVLDIFARINSYTVKLTTQEKFNAKYVGYFKQIVFRYGLKYVRYWLDSGVLTSAKVTRMGEAELSADLFVSLIDAVKTNKGIENYYKTYEDEEGSLVKAGKQFDEIMSYVGAIYPAVDLKGTSWSRIHLFYTLFTVIGHCLYGLNGLEDSPRPTINKKVVGRFRVALDEVSVNFDEYNKVKEGEIPEEYNRFIYYSRRGTTDTAARIYRANFVCNKIQEFLNS